MATNVNELIFIKRVKKITHAQSHSGAWKIAYADFVTAMMAFFLLMWLLNATTEEQRTAISNYFAPASVSKSLSGAGGVLGGRTLDSEGAMIADTTRPGLILGIRVPEFGNADEESEEAEGAYTQRGPVAEHDFEGASGSQMGMLEAHDQEQGGGSYLGTVEKNDAKDAKREHLARADRKSGPDAKLGATTLAGPSQGADGFAVGRGASDPGDNMRQFARREQQRFDNAEAALKKLFDQDPGLRPYRDNLRVEQIGAGLRIQLLDNHKVAMFPLGSAEMIDRTAEMMAKIAEIIRMLPNKIAIVGHTDATPYRADSGYGNWELSTDRAHASRRALLAAGLPEDRLVTVTGKAATDPLNKADPEAPANRRISILLLREALPAAALDRGRPGAWRDPYAIYRGASTPPRSAPNFSPQGGPSDGAPDEVDGIDPLEQSLFKDLEVESVPAKEPSESARVEEADAEAEVPPPVETEPVQDGEIIDSDLWQRL